MTTRNFAQPTQHYITHAFVHQDDYPIQVGVCGVHLASLRGAAWHADRWHGAVFFKSGLQPAMVAFCYLSFATAPLFAARDVGMQQELLDSLTCSAFRKRLGDEID